MSARKPEHLRRGHLTKAEIARYRSTVRLELSPLTVPRGWKAVLSTAALWFVRKINQ